MSTREREVSLKMEFNVKAGRQIRRTYPEHLTIFRTKAAKLPATTVATRTRALQREPGATRWIRTWDGDIVTSRPVVRMLVCCPLYAAYWLTFSAPLTYDTYSSNEVGVKCKKRRAENKGTRQLLCDIVTDLFGLPKHLNVYIYLLPVWRGLDLTSNWLVVLLTALFAYEAQL